MTRIYFNEVVTRDGFQIEPHFVATDDKIALINALSACGYAKIEATSFTSPKAISMLRDAEEVMGRLPLCARRQWQYLQRRRHHMLDAMGYDTGIDLPQLLRVARALPELVGHDVPGQVAKAGRITDLHPAPGFVHETKGVN